jgi:uncharacterized protein YcnI
MKRLPGRLLAVAAAAAVAALGFAAPASAHVTVSSAGATQGGYAKLTFRVPNEKDAAQTVKLEVLLPPDAPIASVSVKPVPGWTAQLERTKLATPIRSGEREITEVVSKITWTAAPGAAIAAGQFQEFDVSAGPLPKVDQLAFKALQTYSDNDVVRWIEIPKGGEEPDHPAPVLKLAAATESGPQTVNEVANQANQTATGGSDDAGGSGWGIGLGIAGLAAGLAGLAVGLLAYRRSAAMSSAANAAAAK